MDTFLPSDYAPPATSNNYLKWAKGSTRFRFLSSPITGWVYFTQDDEGKKSAFRVRPTEEAPSAILKAKHFWAAIVWDYQTESLKILEITQKSIQAAILNLNSNKAWGNPKEYDLCVTREGEDLNTTYSVMPEPKTPIDEEIIEESKKINLEALFDNADPFAGMN